ncbi:aminopeptidase [candidate division KSB1 bacterium]|nr:aminopeptidase [candidate division KSB1 bacterium]RQW00179.1 MAG: aminopeptidase [candidate division KSB1 bacterium]
MTRYEKAAQTIVNKCLDLKKEESVLIVASEALLDVADILFKTCLKRSKHAFLLKLSHLSPHVEIFPSIARLMKEMNIVFAITSPSISHTDARRQACRAGARIISMPDITMNTFSRIAQMNIDKIIRRSKKIADILSMAKEARLSAPNGTEVFIPIKKHKGYADTGIVDFPGAFSNLPAGEASIAPDEGLCRGQLVVDSGMGINSKDQDRVTIILKEGRAVRISGGPAARKLSQYLSKFGSDSRLVAEFGIGTNDAAQISGCTLEDEKVLGTTHVALGNNISFGGTNNVPVHLDAIVFKSTVEIDGKIILDRGKLAIE